MPNSKRPVGRRFTISIIGSGRLGTALALALSKAGHSVESLVARRQSSSRKASRLLQHKPLALSKNKLTSIPASQILLITTPDDIIEKLATELANAARTDTGRRTVFHTSGALSSSVLRPLAESGFNVGSLHPLVSVSEPILGAEALKNSFWCLEGDASALRIAQTLLRSLDGHSFSVSAENKPLYHAAALMVSGHLTALVDLAIEMLASCGLSQSQARRALLPLVQSAVGNLQIAAPATALTGPFARGDVATVERHLCALSNLDRHFLEVYKILGRHSLVLARKRGLRPVQIARMEKLMQ